MARNHSGQMALYEALNKERFRVAQEKELSRVEQVKREKAFPVQPVTIPPQSASGVKKADIKQTVWTKKPAMFGLNNGRFEAYVPYPIAVTAVMGIVLALLIAFQCGQFLGKRSGLSPKVAQSPTEKTVNLAETAKAAKELARFSAKRSSSAEAVTPVATTTTVEAERTSEPVQNSSSEAKDGDFPIVLAELKTSRDLEPVKQYFDEHGIATEIKNSHGSYFLVTKEKYESLSPGTPGHTAVEKIKQVGSNYKPPKGYGGFGSKPFSDAYGRKL